MFADPSAHGIDPRRTLSAEDLAAASRRAAPEVARTPRAGDALGLAAGVVGALAVGAFTLVSLSHERATAASAARSATAPLPAPLVNSLTAPLTRNVRDPIPTASPAPLVADQIDPNQSRSAPLIVDNTGGGAVAVTAAAAPGQPAVAAAPNGQKDSVLLSLDEQFAARVGGSDAVQTARATGLGDPASTVVQGTIIPAVLETALNSDLPGYARALVSRDIKSFDGSRVAIPRGSRLIGQYKSALVTGQSRAFIVWTRLIRPDGVSVQLASPVMDSAGSTGLAGRVDRHFAQRFGAAALLSVVSGLASSLSGGSSSTVVIGSSVDAQGAAGQALASDGKIPPTIRVPLGTPIQVFTARDLDFSGH